MLSEPELRQLRTFVVVAEELHFTRASKRLHMAQQALSAQIRNLEARLGARLFERTTRQVELTDAGRTLLAHAVPLLAAATRAWDEVERAAHGELDEVSVSYAPTARREILPRVLEEFHRRHPDLHVRTCEAWLGGDTVAEAIADVAITRRAASSDPLVSSVTIRESPLGVVLGAAHPLAAQPAVSVQSIDAVGVRVPARRFSPGFHDVIMSLLRERGFDGPVRELENLSSGFLLDDEPAQAEILAGGAVGVGFENQYANLPPELVWRPIDPPLLVPMKLCWRQGANAAVRRFVSVALDVAQSSGWVARLPRETLDVA